MLKKIIFMLALLSSSAWAQVSVYQMEEKMKQGVPVYDIREPDEHARGVVQGVKLLPMSTLGASWWSIPKEKEVLLICNTQNRSKKVVQELKKMGYDKIQYVDGGMSYWYKKGYPTQKPSVMHTR